MPKRKSSRSRQHPADADLLKGAVETDAPRQPGNNSLHGQLGHRTEDDMIKSSDTDFPEPGGNPEHSGEPEEEKPRKASRRNSKAIVGKIPWRRRQFLAFFFIPSAARDPYDLKNL